LVVVISWRHRTPKTIVENATTRDTTLGDARRNLEPTRALVKHVEEGLALQGAVAMEEGQFLEGAVEERQFLEGAVEEGLALEGAVAVEEGQFLEGAVDPVVLRHVGLIGEGLSTCC
jgi:hypothetical protein